MNKLVQVGKLKDTVVTTDGSKQYLNFMQIAKEIISLLEEKRVVNIERDLCAVIGVSREIIMKVLNSKVSSIHPIHIIDMKDLVVSKQFMTGTVIKHIEHIIN